MGVYSVSDHSAQLCVGYPANSGLYVFERERKSFIHFRIGFPQKQHSRTASEWLYIRKENIRNSIWVGYKSSDLFSVNDFECSAFLWQIIYRFIYVYSAFTSQTWKQKKKLTSPRSRVDFDMKLKRWYTHTRLSFLFICVKYMGKCSNYPLICVVIVLYEIDNQWCQGHFQKKNFREV